MGGETCVSALPKLVSPVLLADRVCFKCKGTGEFHGNLCKCIFRRTFRECFRTFNAIENGSHADVRVAEFCADFYLLAKRALAGKEEHWRVFDLHFLRGLSWPECNGGLHGLSRGNFYHCVYDIEERLGRAFLTTRPYALYPVSMYFGDN
jgi:hypothetical protein